MNDKSGPLLEYVLEHEIKNSERHGHNVSVVLLMTSNGSPIPKSALPGTIRSCDGYFDLDRATVVVMGETDTNGALNAIERYGFSCKGDSDNETRLPKNDVDLFLATASILHTWSIISSLFLSS